MVHQKESNHSCRAPTRVREYPCRLGEPTPYRFQRLEITQGDFSKSGQETGSLLNRFVCLQDKHPIATVLQLEARSCSTGCGCPVNIIGKPPSLHVSPICTDSLLLDQASQRENISGDYSSTVAQSTLVPTITEQSSGHPNPLTTNPRYCDESHGTESPISNTGPSSTSHMASFGRSIHAGGPSERVVDLLQKSWRQLTESAYSSAWRQWDSWCIGRQIDPTTAPVNEILEFLCDQFESGK